MFDYMVQFVVGYYATKAALELLLAIVQFIVFLRNR